MKLKVLRSIAQQFSRAHNLRDGLGLMVKQVSDAIQTECCSVYLLDEEQQEHVMMATTGFNQRSVGRVRLPFPQGLIGHVVKRGEPIHVEDASQHPNYYPIADINEDKFKAFLGVPIIHQRRPLGVLAVQQQVKRKFNEGEEAFLVTISAQLAASIAHAKISGERLLQVKSTNTALSYTGVPGAPGVGIGEASVVYPPADLDSVPTRYITNIEEEVASFLSSLNAVKSQMQQLSRNVESVLSKEEQALFNAYVAILDENSLGQEVIQWIEQGLWAPAALARVIKSHVNVLESQGDDYLAERAVDILDLGRRVLSQMERGHSANRNFPSDCILIGEEITAANLAEAPPGSIRGICSLNGSQTSHVAILAKAMGIPSVFGIHNLSLNDLTGLLIIVDGYHGEVKVAPSTEMEEEYRRLAAEEDALTDDLMSLKDLPAETPDGYQIDLAVNLGLGTDVPISLDVGAQGVGLYRTEVPFMIREQFPSEDEQLEIYQSLLAKFNPQQVTMRTLDIGGDKSLPYFAIDEHNPFLGWRGIRVTLDHPELMLLQMRAMLRASAEFNNLRIMFPMITQLDELEEALSYLGQAYQEVKEECPNLEYPKVGAMIEVPVTVYLAYELALRVDFVSVGSNDLAQYLLAVDRNNARVSNLYDMLNPGVLKMLKLTVDLVHKANKPISICGEMAADPLGAVLLTAMGYDTLSMSANSVPRIKWLLRNINLSDMQAWLTWALTQTSGKVIRRQLNDELEEAGVGGLVRAGR